MTRARGEGSKKNSGDWQQTVGPSGRVTYEKIHKPATDGVNINDAMNPINDLSYQDDFDYDEEFLREESEERIILDLAEGEGFRAMRSEVTDRFLRKNPQFSEYADNRTFKEFWTSDESESLRLGYYDANGNYEMVWEEEFDPETEDPWDKTHVEVDNINNWLNNDKEFMTEFNKGYKEYIQKDMSQRLDRVLGRSYTTADDAVRMIKSMHDVGIDPTMEQRIKALDIRTVNESHIEKLGRTADNRWLLDRGATEFHQKSCYIIDRQGGDSSRSLSRELLNQSLTLDALDDKVSSDPELSQEMKDMTFPGRVPDKMVEHFTDDNGNVDSSSMTQYVINRMPEEKTSGTNLYIHDINYNPTTQSLSASRYSD